MSDYVYILTKEVDYEPSEIVAVFNNNPSLHTLILFFSNQDDLNEIYDTPDEKDMIVLQTAHYVNMGWGHYSISKFYVKEGV